MHPARNVDLGKYRIIAELGRGGMGFVCLAVARGPAGFNKVVVVKQLKPDLVGDPAFCQMFMDEARLGARLSHPNIVQTNEIVCEGASYFTVLEYLEGPSLKHAVAQLRKQGAPSQGLYLRAILDVLSALDYAHALTDFEGNPLRIVHRDVNPHNVLCTFDGQIKLIDFGIAKTAESANQTRTGVIKGKPAYMSPEQAAGEKVDCRADLFSIGAMLWDALAGRRLWSDKTEVELFRRLFSSEPVPSPRTVNPQVPLPLEEVCCRAVALKPEDRFQSAAEFRDALEAALEQTAALSEPVVALPVRDIGALLRERFAQQRAKMKALVDKQLARAQSTATGEYDIVREPEISVITDSNARERVQPSSFSPTGMSRQTSNPGSRSGSGIGMEQSAGMMEPSAEARTVAPPVVGPATRKRPWIAIGGAALLAVLVVGAMRRHDSSTSSPAPGSVNAVLGSPAHPAPPAPSPLVSPALIPVATEAPPAPGVATTAPVVKTAAVRVTSPTSAPEPKSWTAARVNPPPTSASAVPPPVATAVLPSAPAPSSAASDAAPAALPATGLSLTATAAPVAAPAVAPTTIAATTVPAPGTVSREAVNQMVRAHAGDVQACYERAQMDIPNLTARVAVRIQLDGFGHVSGVTASVNREGTARLRTCIERAIAGWAFPAPAGNVPGVVSYNFVLE